MCDLPRKLHSNYECPFDNLIYKVVEPMSDLFHLFNMTPNQITTLSLITGLIAIYYSLKKKIWLFAFFFALSYILDCVDGYYARKYDMCTNFGDFYDHTKDILIAGIVIFIICKHCYKKKIYMPILILFASLYLACMHMGCQQIHSQCEDENSNSINFLKNICPTNNTPNTSINITRFCGTGNLNFIIIIIMFYLFYSRGTYKK
jgi:phosphatidylglycerophosphate synthase